MSDRTWTTVVDGSPQQEAGSRDLTPRPAPHTGVDKFDEATITTPVRAWLGLGACALLVVGVLIWALTARIDLTVTAPGVSLVEGSVAQVVSPVAGTLESISVRAGDDVSAGQELAVVRGLGGQEQVLTAPVAGLVMTEPEGVGAHLEPDAMVLTIERTDGERQLRLFIPPQESDRVVVGTPAVISFPGQADIEGSVAAVGRLPLTHEEIHALVGSEALAHQLNDADSAVNVVVVPDEGFVLPDPELSQAGRFGSVTLIVDSLHPIEFIL